MVTRRGRWYVLGHDRDRDERRTFRLSRITEVTPTGPVAAFTPAVTGDGLRDAVAESVDAAFRETVTTARVWVAADRADGLRRFAVSAVPAQLDGVDGDDLVIEYDSSTALTRAVLAAGPDAVVREPCRCATRSSRPSTRWRWRDGRPVGIAVLPTIGDGAYLAARDGIELDEAAADLGITTAQLTKDIEQLFVCGHRENGFEDLIDVQYDSGYVRVAFTAEWTDRCG